MKTLWIIRKRDGWAAAARQCYRGYHGFNRGAPRTAFAFAAQHFLWQIWIHPLKAPQYCKNGCPRISSKYPFCVFPSRCSDSQVLMGHINSKIGKSSHCCGVLWGNFNSGRDDSWILIAFSTLVSIHDTAENIWFGDRVLICTMMRGVAVICSK